MAKRLADGSPPSFNNPEKPLESYKGLTMVYSRQCPWVPRFLEENKLQVKVVELKTPAQAQTAPSLYGTFSMIYNGKILADRYISTTRFKNILKKEMA